MNNLSFWTRDLLGLVNHIVIRKNFVDVRYDDQLIKELIELFKTHGYNLVLVKNPDDHMEFNGIIENRVFNPRGMQKWMKSWFDVPKEDKRERYPFMIMGYRNDVLSHSPIGLLPG